MPPDRGRFARRPARRGHVSLRLPSSTSSELLRRILVTNRKIQHLVCGFLKFYLTRFRALKPFHTATFSFDSTLWANEERGYANLLSFVAK